MKTIAMVTDFFYPKRGGVESHVLNLSKALTRKGHRVIVITRSFGEKTRGIRFVGESKSTILLLLEESREAMEMRRPKELAGFSRFSEKKRYILYMDINLLQQLRSSFSYMPRLCLLAHASQTIQYCALAL